MRYQFHAGTENEIQGVVGRLTANQKPILLASASTAEGIKVFLIVETLPGG
jgi:hypothetical protein